MSRRILSCSQSVGDQVLFLRLGQHSVPCDVEVLVGRDAIVRPRYLFQLIGGGGVQVLRDGRAAPLLVQRARRRLDVPVRLHVVLLAHAQEDLLVLLRAQVVAMDGDPAGADLILTA